MKNKKIWVGCTEGNWEVFKSYEIPTRESYGKYYAVIGPFRTLKAATFMTNEGRTSCRLVSEAERIVKNAQ